MKLLHAIQIATKGIIGWAVGLATKGYIVKIVEEKYGSPGSSRGGFAKGRKRDEKKVVMVTVKAYGKEITTRHILNANIKINIADIEIIEDETGPIGVSMVRIKK